MELKSKPPLSATALGRLAHKAAVEIAAPLRWNPIMHRVQRKDSMRVRIEDSGTDRAPKNQRIRKAAKAALTLGAFS